MPLHLIELEPNKQLLQSEFEGYKLNLQVLSHSTHELEKPVDRVFVEGVHAKIFGAHNHLIIDPWDNCFSYYYIDKQYQVHHIAFDGRYTFQDRVVFVIPQPVEGGAGFCLSFSDISLAVISNGIGYLHIIDTGNRTELSGGKQIWQSLHSSLPLGEKKAIVIVDCKVQTNTKNKQLHCLLQSVERHDIIYNSVISWIIFELANDNDHTWQQISSVDLKGKGKVHYAAMESNCEAIYVASDSPIKVTKLTADSEHEIERDSNEQLKSNASTENMNPWSSKCLAEAKANINKRLREVVIVQEVPEQEEVSSLVRLNMKNFQITHSVPLSNRDFLFSVQLENYEAPALALRNDVNACIWQPYAQLVDSEMWPIKHQGTLMSFGYLQSIKHNRKFMTCAPNLSYAAICDGERHIFIYESDNNPIYLHRKVMKTMQLEQQHIFNTETYGEVLGLNATNNYLFILTQTYFISIKIK